jgi:hypothetical protein
MLRHLSAVCAQDALVADTPALTVTRKGTVPTITLHTDWVDPLRRASKLEQLFNRDTVVYVGAVSAAVDGLLPLSALQVSADGENWYLDVDGSETTLEVFFDDRHVHFAHNFLLPVRLGTLLDACESVQPLKAIFRKNDFILGYELTAGDGGVDCEELQFPHAVNYWSVSSLLSTIAAGGKKGFPKARGDKVVPKDEVPFYARLRHTLLVRVPAGRRTSAGRERSARRRPGTARRSARGLLRGDGGDRCCVEGACNTKCVRNAARRK